MAPPADLINIMLRTFQIIYAAATIGLSIGLSHGHKFGPVPLTFGYCAFVGVASLIFGVVGLVATWLSFLIGMVSIVTDIMVMILNISGAVTLAIKLGSVSCAVDGANAVAVHKYCKTVPLIGGGPTDVFENWYCSMDWPHMIVSRCKQARADEVLIFLNCGVCVMCILFAYVRMRKGW